MNIRINILAAFLLLSPLFLAAQYPANPGKMRLGFQTTAAGLVYHSNGAPAHTPSNYLHDTWMAFDTVNNVLYYYDENDTSWHDILDGVPAPVPDSVYVLPVVADTSFLSPGQGDIFINAGADTLGVFDSWGWRLFFGGGSTEVADGVTILGDGTGGDPFRVDTSLIVTITRLEDSLAAKQLLIDSLDNVVLYSNMPSYVPVPPCEDDVAMVITGLIIDKTINIGDNISGDITFSGIASMALTYVQEQDGYAYFEIHGSAVEPGTYGPEVEYAGIALAGLLNVVASNPDTVTVLLPGDSILVTRVCGAEISRDTISPVPSDNITGTGTTNRIPVFAGVQALANSYLLQSASAITLDAGKMLTLTGGTTASRPAAIAGGHWYNTTLNNPQWSDGTSWFGYSPWTRSGSDIYFTGGNVGVGVSPTSVFHVRGTGNVIALVESTSASDIGLQLGLTSPAEAWKIFWQRGSSGDLLFQKDGVTKMSLDNLTGGLTITNGLSFSGNLVMANSTFISSGSGLNVFTPYDGATASMKWKIGHPTVGNFEWYDKDNNQILTLTRTGRLGISNSNPTARLHLPAGTTAAGTAPEKYTSGALMTTPEVGAIEFLTDRWYGTITTGAARKGFAFTDDITAITTGLATNDVPRWDGTALAPSGATDDGAIFDISRDEINLQAGPQVAYIDGVAEAMLLGSTSTKILIDDAENDIDISTTDDIRLTAQGLGVHVSGADFTTTVGDYSGSIDNFGVRVDNNNTEILMGNLTEAGNSTIKTTETDINMYAPEGIFIAADDQAIVLGDVLQNGIGMVLELNPGDGGLSVRPWVGNDVTDPSFVLSQIYDGSTGGYARFNNMSVRMSGLAQNGEVGGNLLYYSGFETTDILEKTRTSNSYAAFWEEGIREYALFPTADTITIDTFDFAQRNDAAIDIKVDSIGLSAGGIIVNQKSEAAYWKVDYGFFVDSDEDQIYTFWDLTTDGSEVPERLEGSASRSEITGAAGVNHAGRSFIVRVPSGQGIRLCAYGNPGVTASMDISFLSITVTQVTAP